MNIAIATFDGFNEIDSFVALNILNRARGAGLNAEIVCPGKRVTSMNGVEIRSQRPFSWINDADAVIVGSGRKTRQVVEDEQIMSQIHLNPNRQLVASQCSGALILKRLGLVEGVPVCTDTVTRPWLEEMNVTVLDAPFHAEGDVATAGGCLSAQYLSAWVISRLAGVSAARSALEYVAPVGEKADYVERALHVISRGEAEAV